MKTRLIAMVIIVLGTFWASITEGQALRDVFKRVNSSVVVIRAVETNVIAGPPSQPAIAGGLGSGVLISTDGEIMTAAHLVETADTVFVEFSNQEIFTAKVIASEPAADVALLKLNSPLPSGAVVAKLGDSDKDEVGDQIFVIGAPHGISYTLTVGYISARRRPNTLYSGLSLAEFFKPMQRLTREIPAVQCLTWRERSSASSVPLSRNLEVLRDWALSLPPTWRASSFCNGDPFGAAFRAPLSRDSPPSFLTFPRPGRECSSSA